MGIYEFMALDKDSKANVVWGGKFLADRIEYNYGVQLYFVSNFFVEVYYNRYDNKIEKIKPFKTKRLLEPYLDKIDIDFI